MPCLASLFFRQTRSGSSLNILFVLCPRSSRVPRTHELARPARRATALRCFHFCFCTKHCKQTPRPRRIALALQFTFSSCSPDCELGQTSAVCSSFRCGQGALRLQVNAPRVKSRVVRSSPRFCRRRYAMAAPRPRLPRRGACATATWSPSASPPPPRTPCRTTVRSKPASALAQTLYCLFLHSAF